MRSSTPSGGVIGPDGGISGPSRDAFLDRNTGLADVSFLEPGSYVMVARVNGGGGYFTPWSAPINFRVKAPFDLSYVGFPDQSGPSYKLRGDPARPLRPRQARDRLLREGQEGRQVPQARPQLEDQLQEGVHAALHDAPARHLPPAVPLQGQRHWCSAARSPSAIKIRRRIL